MPITDWLREKFSLARGTKSSVALDDYSIKPLAAGQNDAGAFAWDNPWAFYTPQSPTRRPGSLVDTATLRKFADSDPVTRACITQLQRECAVIPIEVAARDASDDRRGTRKDIEAATAWMNDISGGLGGFGRRRNHFESALIEDVLVIGAGAIHLQRNLAGGVNQAVAIDAATIRPVTNAYGWVDDRHAYEQWIQGVQVARFAADEMIYDGIEARSYTPYFVSRVEMLLSTILASIKAQEWNLAWLTDGNTPDAYFTLPESWTMEQCRQFATWFNDRFRGNTQERATAPFLPSGAKFEGATSRQDMQFQEFEVWLMKKTCSIFGVAPASIGFLDKQYKESQETSTDATSNFGAGVILQWRKDVYDELLRELGYGHLEVKNVIAWEEDALQRAQRLTIATGGQAWISLNEARKADGYDAIAGADALPASQKDDSAPAAEGSKEPGAESSDRLPADSDADRALSLQLWEKKALKRLKEGRGAACRFTSESVAQSTADELARRLNDCKDATDVRSLFDSYLER